MQLTIMLGCLIKTAKKKKKKKTVESGISNSFWRKWHPSWDTKNTKVKQPGFEVLFWRMEVPLNKEKIIKREDFQWDRLLSIYR